MNLSEFRKELEKLNEDDIERLKETIWSSDNIIIIGNGGSNSIASHISQDYTKQLGKRAFSFSDPSRLTCYINDYGMDNAYKQFLSEFVDNKTLVILISSSGNSKNIVNCARWCIQNNVEMITLSGFDINNKLKTLTQDNFLHFWVNSKDYGVVECIHQIILHTVV